MKIAMFTDTYTPQINGVTTSIDTFAGVLRKRGHTVVIIAPREGGQRSTAAVWRLASIPFPFQTEYRMTVPLSAKLTKFARHRFDIIHIQSPFILGHLGQYLAWKHGIPSVYTYHTMWSQYLHYLPILPQP